MPQENIINSILEFIEADEYDNPQLKKLLSPVDKFLEEEIFIIDLQNIIDVFIEDNSGNKKFTIKDFELFSNDYICIKLFTKSLILIQWSLSNNNLKYNSETSKDVLFKLYSYFFLILIPKKTSKLWNLDEKRRVAHLITKINGIYLSPSMIKDQYVDINKIIKKKRKHHFKSKKNEEKQIIIEDYLQKLSYKLATFIQNNKDKIRTNGEIKELKREIKKLQKK